MSSQLKKKSDFTTGNVTSKIIMDLPDQERKKLFSTNNYPLINDLIRKLVPVATTNPEQDDYDLTAIQVKNKLSAVTTGDGLEAMISAQMVALHDLQLHAAGVAKQYAHHEKVMSSYVNMTTKLSNAFLQQAQLLSKLQGKGQQKVTVEHVNVHSGGQAIVGHITNQPGVPEKNEKN